MDLGVPTKAQFCEYCRLLYQTRLVAGTSGNLAVRAGANAYLTPSGYSLRAMTPDLVVTVDPNGNVLEGQTPTTEAQLHLGVLRRRTDINVVCHVHGAFIIAATTMLNPGPDSMPPLTPSFALHAHPLPMVPVLMPGTRMLAEIVSREFAFEKTRALLLQNHGLVTLGKTFEDAFNLAEEIEEVARIYVLTGGNARPLSPELIEKIPK